MIAIDDPVVKDAAEGALSALLVDRDVEEILSLEGGLLEVLRRGKRERLDAILEGPLFALLRESGADQEVVEMKLRGGHRLVAGPLSDGRLSLRVQKQASLEVSLEQLEEEQLLPPGIGDELVAAVMDGAGLLVIGPSRVGRQRVVLAVARAVQQHLGVASLTEGAPLGAAPLPPRAALEHRVEAASELGADLLFGFELSTRDLSLVGRARPALPLLCSALCPSFDALKSTLDVAGLAWAALAGNVAVIGSGPDGRPRLAELHGESRTGGAADADADADVAHAAPPAVGARQRPGGALEGNQSSTGDTSHDGPPGSWASQSPDDDPGWELADAGGGPPPEDGSFDAVLQVQRGRPTFTPRPPREHPQAQRLKLEPAPGAGPRAPRGVGGGGGVPDPFGGLTFEPPPGGPEPHDDDEEPR